MSFTFTNSIPAPNNNPSDDQPLMLVNNISTEAILGVDHITFNLSNGGTHQQVTMVNNPDYLTPPTVTGNGCVVYSAAGTAATSAQLFFDNAVASLHLSPIRAWAFFDGTSGAIIASQSVNVSSITHPAAGTYDVTLEVGSFSGTNFAVIATPSLDAANHPLSACYHSIGAGTFSINVANPLGTLTDCTSCSFLVLQL